MLFQPILALIILRFLRKSLKASGQLAKWDKYFIYANAFFIAMLVLSIVVSGSRNILSWLGHASLFALVYLVYTQKELKTAKPTMVAVLPIIGFYFIEDVVTAISSSFHKTWSNYFDAAEAFAYIWMAAMLFISNRQQKALEKERIKAEEKEKEYKITESLRAELEVQVGERTAELTKQKEELQQTLHELQSTQSLLIQSEKMASLGELTAGIAHEIQNPLNFVNNFSEVNTELIAEMKEEIEKGNFEEVKALANDIADNEQKINHHGKRADSIVKGMLQHSRSSSGQKEPTDINKLADEYLRLAYHGLRAKDKSFNATMKTDYDESIGNINILPQDIGRVILNLITNAFYAVQQKKKSPLTPEGGIENSQGKVYEPTVSVSTVLIPTSGGRGAKVQIKVADNGNGIPQSALDKIFQPFFTTKPTAKEQDWAYH